MHSVFHLRVSGHLVRYIAPSGLTQLVLEVVAHLRVFEDALYHDICGEFICIFECAVRVADSVVTLSIIVRVGIAGGCKGKFPVLQHVEVKFGDSSSDFLT